MDAEETNANMRRNSLIQYQKEDHSGNVYLKLQRMRQRDCKVPRITMMSNSSTNRPFHSESVRKQKRRSRAYSMPIIHTQYGQDGSGRRYSEYFPSNSKDSCCNEKLEEELSNLNFDEKETFMGSEQNMAKLKENSLTTRFCSSAMPQDEMRK